MTESTAQVSTIINASHAEVWSALTDPEIDTPLLDGRNGRH